MAYPCELTIEAAVGPDVDAAERYFERMMAREKKEQRVRQFDRAERKASVGPAHASREHHRTRGVGLRHADC